MPQMWCSHSPGTAGAGPGHLHANHDHCNQTLTAWIGTGLYLRGQNSNLAADAPPSLPGYTVLAAQDYGGHDFSCQGSLKPGYCNLPGTPQVGVQVGGSQSRAVSGQIHLCPRSATSSRSCNSCMPATLPSILSMLRVPLDSPLTVPAAAEQSLSQACNRTAQCTGFVYQPANADPDPAKAFQASGWLKTDGPLNASCTSVSTFLTTYQRIKLPNLQSSGPNTAAIAGGGRPACLCHGCPSSVCGGVCVHRLLHHAAPAWSCCTSRQGSRV